MEPIRDALLARMKTRFGAYLELAGAITPEVLTRTLDVPKHKTLADHFWCVVGARESHARALEYGDWVGFACSMERYTLEDFRAKLASSSEDVLQAIDGVTDWTPARGDLMTTLAEHEVMHAGQIIRHMYGLGLELPESWFWA